MKNNIISVIISIVFGALIWLLSPILIGEKEPWDSFIYYTVSLLASGFIGGILSQRYFWISGGIWIGQMIGFLECIYSTTPIHLGPLWPIGFFICLPLFSFLSSIGAIFGYYSRDPQFRRRVIEKLKFRVN